MDFKQYYSEMNSNYFRENSYHPVKNPAYLETSGNLHIINAIHYTILERYKANAEREYHNASSFISDCMERFGIYNRAPTKFDHQAHDDYIGIAIQSKLFNLAHARFINSTKYYYFDNTEETNKFEIKNWHGRFPWALFTYNVCDTGSANLFYQLGFCAYLWTGIRNKDLTDTSGRILRWLQKEAVKGKYKLVDWFIGKWEKDLASKYPGGIGEVMGIYYGPDHPFALVLKGEV